MRTEAIDGVELVPLLEEELLVALPATHRLAGEERIRIRDLREETWIEGAFPDCLGPIPRLAQALGGPPRIGFTCDDWNGKHALVAGGAGIMLVPTLARAAVRRELVLVPTTPRLPPRRLYAAAAHSPYRSPAAEAMLALLTTMSGAVE